MKKEFARVMVVFGIVALLGNGISLLQYSTLVNSNMGLVAMPQGTNDSDEPSGPGGGRANG
jgi:hypothetical protein